MGKPRWIYFVILKIVGQKKIIEVNIENKHFLCLLTESNFYKWQIEKNCLRYKMFYTSKLLMATQDSCGNPSSIGMRN